MVLQSIILPNKICEEPTLYFRKTGNVIIENNSIVLEGKSSYSTDTYMNIFDCKQWAKYTHITTVLLVIEYSGQAVLELHSINAHGDAVMRTEQINSAVNGIHSIEFDINDFNGACYCKMMTDSRLQIFDMRYQNSVKAENIQLGVIICTYKRKKQLFDNLSNLHNSLFFDETSELFGKLNIYVVDNASEIELGDQLNTIVLHNKNTGGSGGFKRGIIEVCNNKKITNVIFMDDDVEFVPESLYRLYSLLAYIKDEHKNSVVAGRMFRTDVRFRQYTACEVWNHGNITHIGFEADMRNIENVLLCNNGDGEYSGWWFACFPAKYVRENEPMPFFLHCDDVEYGLRHGGIPIILNGIQVWHETFEYRQSPIIAYYDWRNSLFVNAEFEMHPIEAEMLQDFLDKITHYHIKKEYDYEYMIIRAMGDFLRGKKWLYGIDSEKYHYRLQRSKGNKYKNAILWRRVKYILKNRLRRKRKNEFRC